MDELEGLFVIGLVSVIIFWFYSLFFVVIPDLSLLLYYIGNLTLIQIVRDVLFFIPFTFPLLIIDFIVLIVVISELNGGFWCLKNQVI